MTVAIRHIFKRSIAAIYAVVRLVISKAIGASIIKPAEIYFDMVAFQDINFTSSERIVFSFLACWRFVEVAKPFYALCDLVVAQSDIIKK